MNISYYYLRPAESLTLKNHNQWNANKTFRDTLCAEVKSVVVFGVMN